MVTPSTAAAGLPLYGREMTSARHDTRQDILVAPRTHSSPTPTTTTGTNEERDIAPPAYSQYEPLNVGVQAIPPPVLAPRAPSSIVYRAPGVIVYPPINGPPRLPPPPPIRPVLRTLYEAMQRGEFVPEIIIEEHEQPTFPLNLSGRRRKYEEDSDDEEEDEEEERYAKRSRVSWGPLNFLRSRN
ncbi:hypothetical protein C8R44DRAFT_865759 [Mycena epipterygia]|nr:hypothetical protein C8R44DRAFT_865759 [Mycena epipterygia]